MKTLWQVAYEAYWLHGGGHRPRWDQVQHQSAWEVGIKAAIAEHEARKRQGMETAPKDGTKIDLWTENGRIADCWWSNGYWVHWWMGGFDQMGAYRIGEIPTHWMPVPEGPR